MMKKTIVKILSAVSIFFLFISASKPSLDGRALVAAAGELPPGLYVKAAAFLPGDTVLITNPAAKVSIEALVFATFSASDGIAVVLSPEAAKLLFIAKDSNSIVQITKNGSDMELSVLSKAFETLPPGSSADNKHEAAADDSLLYEQTAVSASSVESVEISAAPAQSDTFKHSDTPGDDIPSQTVVLSEEPTVESVGEPVHNVVPAVTEIPAVPPETVISEGTVSENVPTENPGEESIFTPFADPAAAEHAQAPTAPDRQTENETAVPESIDSSVDIPIVAEKETDTAPSDIPTDTELSGEPEVLLVQEEIAVQEEKQSEPNVLVATQDRPPVADPLQEAESFAATGGEEMLPGYFAYVPETSAKELNLVENNDTFEASSANMEQYIIESVQSFGKGTYCIQLATYKDTANISRLIEKYGGKYPIRLATSEKVSGAYQVLIGPLNKDEYPVVLKRFVSWGFKDAFLREVR